MKAVRKRLIKEFPHLYWTTFAIRCADLILKDFSTLDCVARVISTTKMITNYIYKYDSAMNYMKKFANGRDIIRPCLTQISLSFSRESLVRHKTTLRDMRESLD